ncbi:hypothetical protein H0Z09_07740 [Pseudomonas sp. SWRI18]|uniref:hypothetical protein n=1 Tax=Pseudomonas sp. SWRI18 TaxID=2753888 RepID=UPI001645C67F|nr:hypothetical protein [Pseudomonas sp. SWRI18]MBC3301010.1 hypothetical protein [Pseudomonas sp. SWRI18]
MKRSDGSASVMPSSPRREADKQLADMYRKLLLKTVDGENTIAPYHQRISSLSDIPGDSNYGLWRALTTRIVDSGSFQDWVAFNDIDMSRGITISPKDNCIVAVVDGKTVHFPNANFPAFPLLIKAAKAFGQTSDIPYYRHTVYARDIAQFYGKNTPDQAPQSTLKDRIRASAAELEDGTAFSDFDPGNLHSDAELLLHDRAVDEINDRNALIWRLKVLAKGDPQSLSERLENTTFGLPSTGEPDSIDTQDRISVGQYIRDQHWMLPTTAEELNALVTALETPTPGAPPYGNLGGATNWPVSLSDTDINWLYRITARQTGEANPFVLVGYLFGNQPAKGQPSRNPRQTIEQMLESPKAQDLGKALQENLRGVSTATSAGDYVLAAIHEAFEPRESQPLSRTKVAGFELAQPGHSGLTASAVVKRMADHLVASSHGKGRSYANDELALATAHLLLAKRAPQYLVKDIPATVTYGSQAWLTFSTAVAKIEAQTPGATATMKYVDILRQGDIAPLTPEQQQVERNAKMNALMDWGVANKLIPLSPSDDYTADQMKSVLAAFQKQMTELLHVVETGNTPLPLRKNVAAEQLYEALGFNQVENHPDLNALMSKVGIPGASTEQYRKEHGDKAAFYDFINTRFIVLDLPHKDFPGPYSLLDLHASNRLFNPPSVRNGRTVQNTYENKWKVLNRYSIEFPEIFNKSSGFPEVAKAYQEELEQHIDSLVSSTKTTVKYLISRLPADDLEFINNGKLTFFCEQLIYDPVPGSNHVYRAQPVDNKPVVVRSQVGSDVRFYEINPQKGHVARRMDLEKKFILGHRQSKAVVAGNGTDAITVQSYAKLPSALKYTYELGKLGAGSTPGIHDTYNSRRVANIADFVTNHVYSGVTEKLREFSKGATTFDTEVPGYAKFRNFLLNFVPLYSAIKNFSSGNFAEGIGDLALDILGFVTAGASVVAKALKGLAVGSKVLFLTKIIGRAAISLLNPLDGIAQLIQGLGRGIHKIGSTGKKYIQKLHGSVKRYDLIAAAKKFDACAVGTFKHEGKIIKGPAVLTGGVWHAYDPVLRQPFGSALTDFIPSIDNPLGDWAVGARLLDPKTQAIKDNWEKVVKGYKFGDKKAEFEAAYYATDLPEGVSNNIKKMTPLELMKQAQKKDVTASTVGALVRQYDNLAFKHGHKGAARFIDNIDPEFGVVFPMPQASYLSSTAQFSDGQCAALARTFATAIEEGKDTVFINNLYKASARAETAASRDFMQSIKNLQTQVGPKAAFHAQKVPRLVTYQEMCRELSNSDVTKSLMIDTPGHAMAAGVIVNGADKKFYFYDPNVGVAYFKTSEAMEAGLTKLFNDKRLPTPYRSHGADTKRLEFKIFDHDDQWKTLNSIDEAKFKKTYQLPLNEHASSSLSHEQLKSNWETLHKALGDQDLICYEASMRVGQAEKNLPSKVYDAVVAATNRNGGTNYSPRYLALMGVEPGSLKTKFNPDDITESGLLNFKHATPDGEFGHTVYIQKAENNELYLFNLNSPDLDVAMIRNGNPPVTSAGMTVYSLGNGKHKGLQNFLDGLDAKPGWQFAYTPASTLTANVEKL